MHSYNPEIALKQAREFFEENPDIELIEAIQTDLNGVSRGKWLPKEDIESICNGNYKISLHTVTTDIWGREVPELIEGTGDGDDICLPVMGSLKRIPWLKQPTAQLFLQTLEQGEPCENDPRVLLQKVVRRYQERGYTAVTAPELEYYLFLDRMDDQGRPQLPASPLNGNNHTGGQLYSTDILFDHQDLLLEIRTACMNLDVPITVLGKELSPGQWELNLNHGDDPVTAADHTQSLKRVIKSVAKNHGFIASFMAKPFADLDGNGFHVHVSILDSSGDNIFNDGTDKGSSLLRYAIGGLAQTMPDTFLMYAPHLNSYRRLQIGNHAPKAPTWGYENRYVSTRIPNSSPAARRLEFRLPGADANPYLVMAALLSGVLHGIDYKIDPGAPCDNRETAENAEPGLPQTWHQALEVFQNSGYIKEYLGEKFQTSFGSMKHYEQKRFDQIISKEEYESYLVIS